jgi:hypothetical protein
MTVTGKQLDAAARAYEAAIKLQPHRATQLVAEALGVSRATAIRHIARAREMRLITDYGDHGPRRVRWSDSSEAWLACSNCRSPWPCTTAIAEHPEQFGGGAA